VRPGPTTTSGTDAFQRVSAGRPDGSHPSGKPGRRGGRGGTRRLGCGGRRRSGLQLCFLSISLSLVFGKLTLSRDEPGEGLYSTVAVHWAAWLAFERLFYSNLVLFHLGRLTGFLPAAALGSRL
jgi:hypothetical protein